MTQTVTPLERLDEVYEEARKVRDRLEAELTELEDERDELWVRHDVEGEDVEDEIEQNEHAWEAKGRELNKATDRLNAIERRRERAQDGVQAAKHRERMLEMQNMNDITRDLFEDYRQKAAAFFTVAAELSENLHRKRVLADKMGRYTSDHPDAPFVAPEYPADRLEVDWNGIDRYKDDFVDFAHVDVRIEFWHYDYNRRPPNMAAADILERAAKYYGDG